MLNARRIPLAWKNLTHEPRRLLIAVGGIGFAVVLICMQLGFRNALFDSTIELHRSLNADIVMTSAARYTLSVRETFSRRRLYQAESCSGVAAAYPLYIEMARSVWKNPETGQGHLIRILAFDPAAPVLDLVGIDALASELIKPRTVLADERSKADYGKLATGETSELAGRETKIIGRFRLGTDFANDGNLIMSADNYANYFGYRGQVDKGLGEVDVGLITVKPGASVAQVLEELRRELPEDVRVMTKDQFIEQELRFWRDSTPIGFVFGLGTAMGFIVGVVICYQVLYGDIDDHMAEFATLKAMGYRNVYFVGMVLQEALLLSIFGFIPGVLVSGALYKVLEWATGLLLDLTLPRAASVLALTVLMCVVSGCLAMRRLLAADPAELF